MNWKRAGRFAAMEDINDPCDEVFVRRHVGWFERRAAKYNKVPAGKARAKFQRGYHQYLKDGQCPCSTCTGREEYA